MCPLLLTPLLPLLLQAALMQAPVGWGLDEDRDAQAATGGTRSQNSCREHNQFDSSAAAVCNMNQHVPH